VGDNIIRAEKQKIGFLLVGKLRNIDSGKELTRHKNSLPSFSIG